VTYPTTRSNKTALTKLNGQDPDRSIGQRLRRPVRIQRDARLLERRRLTVEAVCALVLTSRQHETNGAEATSQFLRGVDRLNRMRMKPRGARGGRHEHHDRPYKAVKHTLSQASEMPLFERFNGRFQRIPRGGDYDFVGSETTL
jgi:hypothetical protein